MAQRIILHSHFHCSLGFHPSHLQFCFPFSSTCSACIYVLLSFHCFPLFPLSSGPSFVYPALSPSPSICMCFYVCVAAGCLWLFFRQRPRRLDCHNVWSWVISVSNPNQETGTFFLFFIPSSLPPPPFSFSFPPSFLSLLSNNLLCFPFLLVPMNSHLFSTVTTIQALACDQLPKTHAISDAIIFEFSINYFAVCDNTMLYVQDIETNNMISFLFFWLTFWPTFKQDMLLHVLLIKLRITSKSSFCFSVKHVIQI